MSSLRENFLRLPLPLPPTSLVARSGWRVRPHPALLVRNFTPVPHAPPAPSVDSAARYLKCFPLPIDEVFRRRRLSQHTAPNMYLLSCMWTCEEVCQCRIQFHTPCCDTPLSEPCESQFVLKTVDEAHQHQRQATEL